MHLPINLDRHPADLIMTKNIYKFIEIRIVKKNLFQLTINE